MNINPNDPANPCSLWEDFPAANSEFLVPYPGMSIRMKFAESAMVAFLHNKGCSGLGQSAMKEIAGYAITMADEMINALNSVKA